MCLSRPFINTLKGGSTMIQVNNVFNNENMKVIASSGPYFVYEHQADLSVTPYSAASAYFMHQMNVRRRQLLVQLNNSAIKMQAGAMQWIGGNVNATTGIKGAGDLLGKIYEQFVSFHETEGVVVEFEVLDVYEKIYEVFLVDCLKLLEGFVGKAFYIYE